MVSRILLKFNIGVYNYLYKAIRCALPPLKDSVHLIYKRGAIYKISCKDCSSLCIGKMGRATNTRLSERKRNL